MYNITTWTGMETKNKPEADGGWGEWAAAR